MKKKNISFWLLLPVMALLMGACGESDKDEAPVPDLPSDVPTSVSSPTSLDARYSGSSQATHDIRKFTEFVAKITNLRWQIYKNLTGNFDASKDYVGKYNAEDWDRFFEVAYELYENADDYTEAMQNLVDEGILTQETTRGIPSITAIGSELKKINDALGTGQKKIMEVMRRQKMATPEQWEAAYDALPKELHYGASDWKEWRYNVYNNDFGGGIFNNLNSSRTYMYLCNENSSSKSEFADEANLMCKGVPGLTHVYQVGVPLVKSGRNINLTIQKALNPMLGNFMDGMDIGMASTSLVNAVHKGDPGSARESMLTISNVIVGQVGNLANSPYLLNEGINLSTELFNQTVLSDLNDAESIYSNSPYSNVGLIQVSDEGNDGKPATIYIVNSPNGGVKVAFADDKGKAVISSGDKGNATITGIDSNGNVGKSSVSVTQGKTVNVTINTITEENDELPANGFLTLSRESVDFTADEDAMSIGFSTNYHYIGFAPSASWFKAMTRSSLKGNMIVSVEENKTGKDREGTLLVLATDKAGKVQKYAKLTVLQEASEGGIIVSPEELHFAYNNYAKSTYVTLTGWPYFGAFTEKEEDESWISFSCDQGLKYISVTVQENKTGKERRAKCYVYGCNDPNKQYGTNEVQKVPFVVVQDPEGTLTLSPDKLEFNADGGSSTLNVTVSGYIKLGSVIDNDGQGWLTVTPHGDKKTVDVVCAKNETKADRTGHFYVFGTNYDDPLVGDCKMVRVEVKQKAGSQQISQVKISSVAFKTRMWTNVKVYHHYWGSTELTGQYSSDAEGCFTESRFTEKYISCSFSGSSLHADIDYENRGDHHILSFDVTGIKGDYKEARVTNLTWKRVYLPESVFGYDNYNISVSYSNIPIKKVYLKNASDPMTLNELVFDGNVANGMGVSGYKSEKYTNDGWGGYHQSLFEYLNNGENFANLEIVFESVK